VGVPNFHESKEGLLRLEYGVAIGLNVLDKDPIILLQLGDPSSEATVRLGAPAVSLCHRSALKEWAGVHLDHVAVDVVLVQIMDLSVDVV